jgi:hypothetical protein
MEFKVEPPIAPPAVPKSPRRPTPVLPSATAGDAGPGWASFTNSAMPDE